MSLVDFAIAQRSWWILMSIFYILNVSIFFVKNDPFVCYMETLRVVIGKLMMDDNHIQMHK